MNGKGWVDVILSDFKTFDEQLLFYGLCSMYQERVWDPVIREERFCLMTFKQVYERYFALCGDNGINALDKLHVCCLLERFEAKDLVERASLTGRMREVVYSPKLEAACLAAYCAEFEAFFKGRINFSRRQKVEEQGCTVAPAASMEVKLNERVPAAKPNT